MAWKNMGISTILFFAVVFTACGENSENRISDANQSPHENTYKTYDGLVSESPCGLSLNLTIAHVSSTNEDYRCSQSAPSGLWSWEPYYGGDGFVTDSDGRVYETFVDSRDGRVYKKVNIGTQTWMAENLNFAIENTHCHKGTNGFEDCSKARYYTWSDAMDSVGRFSNNGKGWGYSGYEFVEKPSPDYPVRGICPQGWHLPDTSEWNTLISYVGNPSYGLVALGSIFEGETNSSGFSAKGVGYWHFSDCSQCHYDGYILYWSSMPEIHERMLTRAYNFHLADNGSSKFPKTRIEPSAIDGYYAIPVRCIMDRDNGATNEIYASSSSTVIEKTNDEFFTDSRDGRTYKMVTIGTQTWMAENLDFATEQSHCFKGNTGFEDCGRQGIGRYYTWPDAMDSAGVYSKDGLGCGYLPNYQAEKCAAVMSKNTVRGICPQGWHLPDTTEWNTLLNYVGNPPIKLVKRELEYFKGATDTYGFSAIPTGYWSVNSCYECYESLTGEQISFWASTPYVHDKSTNKSYYQFEFSGSSINSNWSAIRYFDRSPTDASYAIPIRCIMDKDNGMATSANSSSSKGTRLSSSSKGVGKSTFTDSRDEQKYNTVTIGNQTWMAENLNFKTNDSFCYDDKEEKCAQYGRLYTWFAAMGHECLKDYDCSLSSGTIQGVCPDGWHIPLRSEFEELIAFVGGQDSAGKMLKSVLGWKSFWIGMGSDAYGFSALPVGYRVYYSNRDIYFTGDSSDAKFWSSEDSLDNWSGNNAWAFALSLSYGSPGAYIDDFQKSTYSFSIRCVKGKATGKILQSSSSSVTKSSSSESVASSSSEKRMFSSSSIVYETLEDSRDGKIYKAVKIGNQTWMAENLNFEAEKSSCYSEDVDNCTKYGRLYSWAVAMDSAGIWSDNGKDCGYGKTCSPIYPVRGVCPAGWHLPTQKEFKTLITAAGGNNVAGEMLRSTSGWANDRNGLDSYGFNAVAAGYPELVEGGVSEDRLEGSYAIFWSSSEYVDGTRYNLLPDEYGIRLFLYGDGEYANTVHDSKRLESSIRCLKD